MPQAPCSFAQRSSCTAFSGCNSGSTATAALPAGDAGRWTEPGAAPKIWYRRSDPGDMILCECEMVPQSAVDEIIATAGDTAPGAPSIEAISLRSRVGKGPCQGSFCGIRVCSHLYDRGTYSDAAGLARMREFFDERFRGQRPVTWGQQAAQMELAEALHCGLLGLDLLDAE